MTRVSLYVLPPECCRLCPPPAAARSRWLPARSRRARAPASESLRWHPQLAETKLPLPVHSAELRPVSNQPAAESCAERQRLRRERGLLPLKSRARRRSRQRNAVHSPLYRILILTRIVHRITRGRRLRILYIPDRSRPPRFQHLTSGRFHDRVADAAAALASSSRNTQAKP